MAQPPFRSDAFEVENADAPVGPRQIVANEANGSLRFVDPWVPGGIDLSQLAGLQQAQRTLIVSQSGVGGSKDAEGNPITTIQEALDAIPDSADVNEQYVILVMPGLYVEDLVVTKDYVTLFGLGGAVLRNATAVSTIRVLEGVATTPRRLTLQGLRVENTTALQSCVEINSAQFAQGTVIVASVPNVGDNITVGGVTLTAVASNAVPAPGEFALGLTTNETATNLAEAISNPVNALTNVVVPSVAGNVITLRAWQPGPGGNAITLATSVALVLVISGGTLTGGASASAGSLVGQDLIEILDCDLFPVAGTGYTVRASAINNLRIVGGMWGSATCEIIDCASANLERLVCEQLVLTYDNTNPNLPVIATSSYVMKNVEVGATGFQAGYVGIGSLTMTDCTVLGATVHNGSTGAGSLTAFRCSFAGITLGGTSPQVVLSNSTRGTLVGGGTGTLAETRAQGSLVFAGTATETFTFTEPQPDLNYTVHLEIGALPAAITDIPAVPSAAKATTGFDVSFGAVQNQTVRFSIFRNV